MNRTHLNHDYYTDIITFDFTVLDCVSGDLFISHERIKENSMTNKVSLENETYRVIIHGVMHLCGYKDKTKTDIATMRFKEEKCLNKLSF
jgi:rRNA maturation RNase YbeY